jgi:hypothetical protein
MRLFILSHFCKINQINLLVNDIGSIISNFFTIYALLYSASAFLHEYLHLEIIRTTFYKVLLVPFFRSNEVVLTNSFFRNKEKRFHDVEMDGPALNLEKVAVYI